MATIGNRQDGERTTTDTISELATAYPVTVLTTTRVVDAARLMSDLGVGDVIVTDTDTGAVVGMLTDRDITLRVVARDLLASATEVADICSPSPTTITASESPAAAVELMRRDSIRRLPVVDDNDRPVAVISVDDLATSVQVTNSELRALIESHADAYRLARIISNE